MGFGPLWRGVVLQHTRGLCGPSVNRWSIKRSPNGTKLDRRSTGSKPRSLGKSQSITRMHGSTTTSSAKSLTSRQSAQIHEIAKVELD